MLDRGVRFIDLDPVVWNRLGEIEATCIPERVSLHVLLERGRVLNAVHSREGTVCNVWIDPASRMECVQHLFDERPDVDDIWLYERSALLGHYVKVNSVDCGNLDVDEYNSLAYTMICGTHGINRFSRDGAPGDFMGRLRTVCERYLPKDCAVILALFRNGALYFNAVLGFTAGKIDLVTTFEHFGLPGGGCGITPDDKSAVAGLAANALGKAIVTLFWQWDDFLRRVQKINSGKD